MKIYIKLNLSYFFVVILSLNVSASFGHFKEKGSNVIVDVKLQDSTIVDINSIQIEMLNGKINTENTQETEFFYLGTDVYKKQIVIPVTKRFTYGIIRYQYYRRYNMNIPLSVKHVFLFEKGDHIQISINGDSLSFRGKGSEKFNCIYEFISLYLQPISSERQKIALSKNAFNNFIYEKTRINSLYNVKMKIIKSYRNVLNREVWNLILADYWAQYNIDLLAILQGCVISLDGKRSINDVAIKKAYFQFFKYSNLLNLSNETLVKSYWYCDFLYRKEKFSTYFFNSDRPGYYKYRYTFKDIYDRIQNDYFGVIKDKLNLLVFYRESKFRSDINLFYDDAIKHMVDTVFKNALIKIKNNNTGKAYPFKLSNDKGNIIHLDDFKGKLLIMDFWFTGCEACSNLAIQMKQLIEDYRSNPNIVFVTVSIDKNRDTWLKSLNDEIYSSSDEINLYTDGLGENHPLIRHYNVLGYPFIMLISKNGEIITTEPPRPNRARPENMLEFKKIIRNNL